VTEWFQVVNGWEQLPDGWSHPDVADVAVDADDRVYVFNRGEHPVIVYTRDGEFVASWGEGLFVSPHAITIGHDGSVFCVDNNDHTVRKFDQGGKLLLTLGTAGTPSDTGYVFGQYLSVTHGGEPFNRPTKVAVLRSGDFYVSDGYGNSRIHRFTAAGELVASWGEPGEGPGEFRLPHAVAVSPDESLVYVADRENDRIQVFDPDGTFLAEWNGVSRPDGLAVDDDGNVYVAELGIRVGRYPTMPPLTDDSPWSRCSIFDAKGSLLTRWGTPDSCSAGSFYAAHGICRDSAGSLYVGEVTWSAGGKTGAVPASCHTLQKFELVRRLGES
jgi:DNA-binding beta-propeller fold protein YncE